MDPASPQPRKLIGAGLACSALIGAGVGIGSIFGNFLQGALRNPTAAPGQFPNLLLGFALAEATGLVRSRYRAHPSVRILMLKIGDRRRRRHPQRIGGLDQCHN